MTERVRFLSAVLVVSEQPERLAAFYRDALGMALEAEQHDDTAPHWGCTLGDIHFAIHPVSDFPEDSAHAVGAVKLAFTVFDMDGAVQRLRDAGAEPVYPPVDKGWCTMTAVRDPDGNYVELTQLGDAWFEQLARGRADGADVIEQWRTRRAGTVLEVGKKV